MILLKGQSLEIRDRFRADAMALNLEERNSTATLTVGPDAPEIAVNDWLQDDTEPGKGIVWRVKSVRTQVETRTRTISLEHVIACLKDQILFGDVTPKAMGGSASSCSARQAVVYALGKQAKTVWRLGEMSQNPNNPYSFNGDTIWAALETVTGSLDGAQWEYDFGALPFTLHIRTAPEGFQSEMRLSRNIQNLSIQIDRTRMYTRHYPIGKNNLHISGEYTSKNEHIWGVVCKVETDQGQETEAQLRAWSLGRLERHCEPLVTVTGSGTDLSAATGEPLDRITLGRRCRLPLPEYGVEMTEKVTKLSWSDKIREPKKFQVTMANLEEDVASILNAAGARSGRGGRSAAKQGEEDHAWFVDTNEHVGMVAEAVAGPGAAKDWSRVASIIVDGEGIHQRVKMAEGAIVKAETAIEQNEESISLTARRVDDAEATLKVMPDKISMAVNDAKSDLKSEISVERGRIGLLVEGSGANAKVKRASIVLAINNGKSSASISADNIALEGTTKLNDVMTVIQGAAGFKKPIITSSNVNINSTGTLNLYTATFQGSSPVTLDAMALANVIKKASVSGNTLTLTPMIGDPITFSKATTLSGAWSGRGKLTVTASPQNVHFYQRLYHVAPYKDQDGNILLDIGAYNGESGTSGGLTGYQVHLENYLQARSVAIASASETITPESGYVGMKSVTVDASAVVDSVTVSSVTNNQSATTLSYVKITGTASNGNTKDLWLYLAKDGDYVELRKGTATGSRIARISVA